MSLLLTLTRSGGGRPITPGLLPRAASEGAQASALCKWVLLPLVESCRLGFAGIWTRPSPRGSYTLQWAVPLDRVGKVTLRSRPLPRGGWSAGRDIDLGGTHASELVHGTGANTTYLVLDLPPDGLVVLTVDGPSPLAEEAIGRIRAAVSELAVALEVRRFRATLADADPDHMLDLGISALEGEEALLVDAKGRLAWANPTFRGRLGDQVEELIGQPVDQALALLGAPLPAAPAPAPTGRGRSSTEETGDGPSASGGEGRDLGGLFRSRFVAQLSHEVRSPLSAIVGYAELIQNGGLDEADSENLLRQIQLNTHHLLALVQDVLDLAAIDAGKVQVNPVVTDLDALVSEVMEVMRPHADARQLGISLVRRGSLPTDALTDPVRLRQVLLNLLSNAIKYTGSGRVELRVEREKSSVSFAVRDTGPGLPPEVQEHMFRPFTRGQRGGRVEGTGLGLSIVHEIVQRMGGNITYSTAPGSGTVFVVSLPLLRAPVATVAGSPDLLVPDLAGRRVLIVEDSPDVCQVLVRYLAPTRATVLQAHDGLAGLALFASEGAAGRPVDLVLMDRQLPGLDGYSVTRRLRQEGFTGPVVAITASAMASDRVAAEEAGCTFWLPKPLLPKDLFGMIHRAMPSMAPTADAVVAAPPTDDAPAVVVAPAPPPLRSSMAEAPDMADLLATYMARLHTRRGVFLQALEEGDQEVVRRTAHQLRGSASSYGYPRLTEAAGELEQFMRGGGEPTLESPQVTAFLAVIDAALAGADAG